MMQQTVCRVAQRTGADCRRKNTKKPVPARFLMFYGPDHQNRKDQQGKGYDPRKLLAPGTEAIKQLVIEKIKEFGSNDKA